MSPSSEQTVTPGFVLLAVWFALINGWRPLATVLGAAVLHELGHCLVLRLAGASITGFRLSALGAVLRTDSRRLSYGRELLALLAGPAANLAGALALTALGRWPAAVGANLILCVCNLLPVRPLDGGRALYLALCWRAGPAAGEAAARWIGAATALVLAAALIWLMWHSRGSLWLLPPAAGLAAAAGREALRGQGDAEFC